MAGRRHSVISSSRDITSFPLKSGPQKNGSIGGSGDIRRPSEVWFGKHERTNLYKMPFLNPNPYFTISDKFSIKKWKVFIDYDQVSEKLIGKRARGSEPDLTKKGNNLGLQWRFSSHPLQPSRSAQMWYKAARNIKILGSSKHDLILSHPKKAVTDFWHTYVPPEPEKLWWEEGTPLGW